MTLSSQARVRRGGFTLIELLIAVTIGMLLVGLLTVAVFRAILKGQEARNRSDIMLARFNPDGSDDRSFGGDGRVTLDLGGAEVATALALCPDGKVVSVYDACSICGPDGFYRSGQMVVCKNCSAPVNPQSVGEAGGCNPIPLKSSTTGDAILVSQADLAQGLEHMKQ